jgi:DeoR family fructose operon transcriptional repressor
LQNFHFRKTFCGADGFSPAQGFMTIDAESARIVGVALTRCTERFILLDSTKIGQLSFVTFAQPEDITLAITDKTITGEQLKVCRNAGLHLRVAP